LTILEERPMELRHLRYFVAVAEELHFRRAAERLHVAQPAISEQIRKLEQELGVRLFDRDQRHVELTDGGRALLQEARHVLRQAEHARNAARNACAAATARLHVGYVADALPAVVPRALRSLASSTPALQTVLETGPAIGLLEAVRAGRLDAAVVCLPAPLSGLRAQRLGVERAVAVLPAGDARATGPHIDLRLVAPERLVVLPRPANPAFYDAVVSACRNAGLSPTLAELGESQVEHALLAVSSGAGMAILPASVADRYTAPGIRFLPVVGAEPACATAVVTRAGASDHAPTAAFLRALERAGRLSVARPAVAPALRAVAV
jgi:DNA-binding transcriptional LysR family regulator